MTTSLPSQFPYPANEIAHALLAPLHAFSFLWRNKTLFWGALFSHITAFALYIFAIAKWVIPFSQELLAPKIAGLTSDAMAISVFSTFFSLSVYVLAIILYSIIGISIANTILSPLFDIIAARSYEHITGMKLPNIRFSVFAKSFFVEVVKVAFMLALVVATVLSKLLILLSPLVFLFSIWFLGWQEIDRTLGLQGLSWRKRLWFGVRHFPACLAFGIWFYVPFLSTLCAFVMTSAAAIVAARVQSEKEKSDIESLVAASTENTLKPKHSTLDDRR